MKFKLIYNPRLGVVESIAAPMYATKSKIVMKNLTTDFVGKTILKTGLFDNNLVISFTDNTFGVVKATTPEFDPATDELSGGEVFVGKTYEPNGFHQQARNQFLIDMNIATNDELYETIIVPKEGLIWMIDKKQLENHFIQPNVDFADAQCVPLDNISCDYAAVGSNDKQVESLVIDLPEDSDKVIHEINTMFKSGEVIKPLMSILLFLFSFTALFSQSNTIANVLNCDCPPLGINYLVTDTLPILAESIHGESTPSSRLYIKQSGNTMIISDTIIPAVSHGQIITSNSTIQGTTIYKYIKTIDTTDVIIQYISKWETGESKTSRARMITETIQKTNSFFHTVSKKYQFLAVSKDDRNVMGGYKIVEGKLIPINVEAIWLDMPEDMILQVWEAKGYKSW